jgi:hypothetical protein
MRISSSLLLLKSMFDEVPLELPNTPIQTPLGRLSLAVRPLQT